MSKYTYLSEVKCAKCGTKFIPQPLHRFKEHGKYYCKWTCFNHRKDKTEKEKRNEGPENNQGSSSDNS